MPSGSPRSGLLGNLPHCPTGSSFFVFGSPRVSAGYRYGSSARSTGGDLGSVASRATSTARARSVLSTTPARPSRRSVGHAPSMVHCPIVGAWGVPQRIRSRNAADTATSAVAEELSGALADGFRADEPSTTACTSASARVWRDSCPLSGEACQSSRTLPTTAPTTAFARNWKPGRCRASPDGHRLSPARGNTRVRAAGRPFARRFLSMKFGTSLAPTRTRDASSRG